MTVRVDEVRVWPTYIQCFRAGSCHLTADSLDELHAFARAIGVRRGWFQGKSAVPHYDLTPARRERAIDAGAVFVPAREQARMRIAGRSALHEIDAARAARRDR